LLKHLACASLIVLAAAPAARAAAPAPAASQASQEAFALARLMSPRDLIVAGELWQFDLNFSKTLLADDGIQATEAEFPGVVEAMAKASRPLVAEQMGKIVDGLHVQLGRLIAAELTAEEIGELTAYYGSPAGQNLLRTMVASVDASEIYQSAMKADRALTEEDMEAQISAAARKATPRLSDSDRDALLALMKRPVFAKLGILQTRSRKFMIDAVNAPDPAYEKRLDEVMGKALEAHIASVQVKKAS
jgi:hypothetical protein